MPTGLRTHVRLHVHQTNFVSGQHPPDGLQAGPVEVILILAVLQEPATVRRGEFSSWACGNDAGGPVTPTQPLCRVPSLCGSSPRSTAEPGASACLHMHTHMCTNTHACIHIHTHTRIHVCTLTLGPVAWPSCTRTCCDASQPQTLAS